MHKPTPEDVLRALVRLERCIPLISAAEAALIRENAWPQLQQLVLLLEFSIEARDADG